MWVGKVEADLRGVVSEGLLVGFDSFDRKAEEGKHPSQRQHKQMIGEANVTGSVGHGRGGSFMKKLQTLF